MDEGVGGGTPHEHALPCMRVLLSQNLVGCVKASGFGEGVRGVCFSPPSCPPAPSVAAGFLAGRAPAAGGQRRWEPRQTGKGAGAEKRHPGKEGNIPPSVYSHRETKANNRAERRGWDYFGVLTEALGRLRCAGGAGGLGRVLALRTELWPGRLKAK